MKRGIKHGHLPGDISKRSKIELLEGRTDEPARRATYKKRILMKERAVLKRRFLRTLGAL